MKKFKITSTVYEMRVPAKIEARDTDEAIDLWMKHMWGPETVWKVEEIQEENNDTF